MQKGLYGLTSRAQRARSAIVHLALKRDRQSSSERARRAGEQELDLFPLLEIESSDVILARTFQGAKLSQAVNNYFSRVLQWVQKPRFIWRAASDKSRLCHSMRSGRL